MDTLTCSDVPGVLIIFCFCFCTSFQELCCSLCPKLQLSSCLFPFQSRFLNVTLSFPDHWVLHRKCQWAITDFIFVHQSFKLNSTKSDFRNLVSDIDFTKAKIIFSIPLWTLSNLSLFFWSTSPRVEHRLSGLVLLWLHRREFVLCEVKPSSEEQHCKKQHKALVFKKHCGYISAYLSTNYLPEYIVIALWYKI